MQLFAFLGLFGKEIRAILLFALFAYVGLAALGILWAAGSGRSGKEKMVNVCVALFLFVILPVGLLINISRTPVERQSSQAKAVNYGGSKAAYARYEELCKSSGEFIHSTAENVEGLFLMKLRLSGVYPDDRWTKERKEKDSLKWREDPFGWWADNERDYGFRSGAYIATFLKSYWGAPYAYVDAVDPEDGKRYRYTGRSVPVEGRDREEFRLERVEVTPDMPLPRYGVTFADITEREDREHWWIAGSSLKVIDLETGELMGERVGHMMVSWLGGHSLAESYGWNTATHACPYERKDWSTHGPTSNNDTMQGTAAFIRKVIRPAGAEPEPAPDDAAAQCSGECTGVREKN